MGITVSRPVQEQDAQRPATGAQIRMFGMAGTQPAAGAASAAAAASATQSSGTYFGPHFMVDPMPPALSASPTIAGQQLPLRTTQAFWDEIINVLSAGPGAGQSELAGFENVYSQLPPADLRRTSTLQALAAIQKNTVRLVRVQDNLDDPNAFILCFDYDSLVPVRVHVYWNARETYYTDKETEETRISFQDKQGAEAHAWTSEILPAGLGMSFSLPKTAAINPSLYLPSPDSAANQWPTSPKTPYSAASSTAPFMTAPESATSPDPSRNNTAPLSSSTRTAVAGMTGVATTSLHINTNDAVVVNVDANPTSPTALRSPAYNNTTSYDTRLDIFPLCIHLEAVTPPSDVPTSQITSNSQTTFATLAYDHHEGYNVKVLKQLNMIDGASYVVQEIYGFVDPTDGAPTGPNSDSQSSMKECVVCMSEAKDTIVLPCRHLCLCSGCADVLRMQGRPGSTAPARHGPPKCPICRQVFHSLLQVSLPEPFSSRDSVASRRRSHAVKMVSDPNADGSTGVDGESSS